MWKEPLVDDAKQWFHTTNSKSDRLLDWLARVLVRQYATLCDFAFYCTSRLEFVLERTKVKITFCSIDVFDLSHFRTPSTYRRNKQPHD